jgi:SAM-dependent methyltransferase
LSEEAAGRHNDAQRAYFETGVKRTMLPTGSAYVSRQVDQLVAFAGIGPEDRVLEVGCGMGRYSLPLADRGIDVEGLDLSPVLLERLRSFDGGSHALPLHCMDILDAPAALGVRFDAVIGFFTLHHLHDLTASFAAAAQLLKPGGRVAFLEPNPLYAPYYLQILLTPGMTWRGDGGIVRMRPGFIRRAMVQAGLHPEATQTFGFFPPLLANTALGAQAERALERIPWLAPWRAFQLFKGVRGTT